MDREAEDFSLEVTTPGIDAPLCNPRQYRKNIGRTLAVVKIDGSSCEGDIVDATDESVMIEWVTREPKPVGKGKVNVTHSSTIPYSEIKKATIVIKF
jgi:ribosome maturation factor RimP